jgi:UTP--glucose-1-phosphate uridylyltransferase
MTALSIRQAIIPAAGYGSRLQPLTKAIPKEMLPIGRKPVLEHVIDELRMSGIERVLIVVSPGKEIIQKYFEDGSDFGVYCEYAVQSKMRGLGDAVHHGEEWALGQHFVVAFGDCIIEAPNSLPLKRLLDVHVSNSSHATVLAERIPPTGSSKYGILDPGRSSTNAPFRLQDIVEKPHPSDAPSDLAVAARWVLSPDIFSFIRNSDSGIDGEVNLTDPVRQMIAGGAAAWAAPLLSGETRRDIGGWDSYLLSCAIAATNDPEFGESVRESVCGHTVSE